MRNNPTISISNNDQCNSIIFNDHDDVQRVQLQDYTRKHYIAITAAILATYYQ